MKFIGVTMDRRRAELFKEFLRYKDIYYEPSECYSRIHIEFRTDKTFEETMEEFEKWLEED